MAKTSISRSARAKGYLVRGIDPIPENWELASHHRALHSLHRSSTVLQRLIADAVGKGDKASARDLRSIHTALQRGIADISGGFVISEIQAEAQKWARAEREAQRWWARRSKRPRLRLVVNNTQETQP